MLWFPIEILVVLQIFDLSIHLVFENLHCLFVMLLLEVLDLILLVHESIVDFPDALELQQILGFVNLLIHDGMLQLLNLHIQSLIIYLVLFKFLLLVLDLLFQLFYFFNTGIFYGIDLCIVFGHLFF